MGVYLPTTYTSQTVMHAHNIAAYGCATYLLYTPVRWLCIRNQHYSVWARHLLLVDIVSLARDLVSPLTSYNTTKQFRRMALLG